jgi:3-methyladenine DNA glycosylase AlkC
MKHKQNQIDNEKPLKKVKVTNEHDINQHLRNIQQPYTLEQKLASTKLLSQINDENIKSIFLEIIQKEQDYNVIEALIVPFSLNKSEEFSKVLISRVNTLPDGCPWILRKTFASAIGTSSIFCIDAVNTLLSLLKDKKAAVRVTASDALGNLIAYARDDTAEQQVTDFLFNLLEHGYDGTCHSIGYSFEQVLGRKPKTTRWEEILNRIVDIIEKSKSKPHSRRCCVEVLKGILVASKSRGKEYLYKIEEKAVSILVNMSTDQDDFVRMSVTDVLGSVSKGNIKARKCLLSLLAIENNDATQVKIVQSIAQLVDLKSDQEVLAILASKERSSIYKVARIITKLIKH